MASFEERVKHVVLKTMHPFLFSGGSGLSDDAKLLAPEVAALQDTVKAIREQMAVMKTCKDKMEKQKATNNLRGCL